MLAALAFSACGWVVSACVPACASLAAAALVLYKDLPTLDHDASPCYIMEEKTAQNPSAP